MNHIRHHTFFHFHQAQIIGETRQPQPSDCRSYRAWIAAHHTAESMSLPPETGIQWLTKSLEQRTCCVQLSTSMAYKSAIAARLSQPPKKEDQASSRCSFHIHDVEHQTKHGCPNEGQGLHRIAIRKQGTSRVTWIADDIPPVLHGILQVSCQIDECSICSKMDTSPLYASSCNVRPRISSRGPR